MKKSENAAQFYSITNYPGISVPVYFSMYYRQQFFLGQRFTAKYSLQQLKGLKDYIG